MRPTVTRAAQVGAPGRTQFAVDMTRGPYYRGGVKPSASAFALVVALAVIVSPAAHADPAPLVFATQNDPPNAIKQADGTWTGIAVELARKIATELGTTLEVKEVSRKDIVSGPLPDADLAGPLVIGEKMNARYELSHAYTATGLTIAIPDTHKESLFAIARRILSGAFLVALIATVLLLGAVGMLMWWVERRPVKPLPPEKQALSKALFWAFEPVIGYKASQHQTRAGRVLGTLWGVCGVVLVSGLTASLASQLTAHKLAPTVRGPDDLAHVRVGVIEHTAGVRYCTRHGIRFHGYAGIPDAVAALEHGELDAVVGDLEDLLYLSQSHPQIRVLPGTFMNFGAGFGLRPDSPLRHDINKAILKITATEDWRAVVASYLGRAE